MAAEPEGPTFAALDRLAGTLPALGLAASGGSDSTALLHLTAAWARRHSVRIEVATVDHGLRAASADEAAAVARDCAALEVPHQLLRWDGTGATGNLMAAARAARLALLGDWAHRRGLPAVALGHTMDDQAETLLMRLGRGAGVDGLSGMAEARLHGGVIWLRPLLGLRRGDLRAWLVARGLGWADDPTNADTAYDRVRARQAIAALGLPVEALARSAAHLAEARSVLAAAAIASAEGFQADRGMLRLRAASLTASPEIVRRLTVAALRWVTGADYPPRGEDTARLIAAVGAGGQGTLDGVIARARGGGVECLREPAAAARAAGPGRCPGPRDISTRKNTQIWDRRWVLTSLPPDACIRATTAADLQGRDWRAVGLPRLALLSAPAIVTAGGVILPLLDPGNIGVEPLRDAAAFTAILQAH